MKELIGILDNCKWIPAIRYTKRGEKIVLKIWGGNVICEEQEGLCTTISERFIFLGSIVKIHKGITQDKIFFRENQ